MLEILCNITQYFQIGGILSIYRSRNKNPIWRITAVLTPLSCNPRLPKSHFKFQYIFPYDCDITSVQKTESMNKYDDDTSELPSEIMFRWLSSMQNEEDVLILKRFERFAKSMINAVIMQFLTSEIPLQISVYFPYDCVIAGLKRIRVPTLVTLKMEIRDLDSLYHPFSLTIVGRSFSSYRFKYYQLKKWGIGPYRKEFSLSPVFILHNSERRVISFGRVSPGRIDPNSSMICLRTPEIKTSRERNVKGMHGPRAPRTLDDPRGVGVSGRGTTIPPMSRRRGDPHHNTDYRALIPTDVRRSSWDEHLMYRKIITVNRSQVRRT